MAAVFCKVEGSVVLLRKSIRFTSTIELSRTLSYSKKMLGRKQPFLSYLATQHWVMLGFIQ